LPGKENFPDPIKTSSIRRTSRETFDSCKPQSLPKWNIVRYSRQNQSVRRSWFSIDKLLLRPPPGLSFVLTDHLAHRGKSFFADTAQAFEFTCFQVSDILVIH
jgi:hypothetical protein